MQNGQRWIIGLLILIALLLGALVFLDVSSSDEGEGSDNNVAMAEVANQSVADVEAAKPDEGGDPIDAAVDNILAADAAATNEVRVATIPRPFWGLWTRQPELCGKQDADDSAVEISARTVAFWEANGEVKSVTLKSPLSIAVDAAFSGEGETWQSEGSYTLSPSKLDLMITNGEGRTSRYKRCG